jgi:hypothetical protein
MGRLDTRLESEAAEFLVLGQLLLNRIPSYKAYTNMPAYDVVATNPERNTSARVSVKSRWRTGAPAFIIRSLDCDFVVIALLNRGSKDGRKEIKDPEYYVVPIDVIRNVPRSAKWNRVELKNIPDFEKYRSRWDLIQVFLKVPTG